jgi:hypothetical protein
MKQLLARTALVTASLALPAAAQQVVFHDGFENGLSNWTTTGLWNLEDSTDPCGAQAGPFVEGTKAAWYGIEGPCNFDTGTAPNQGALGLTNWVQLPNVPSISLRFWSWSHTEYCWGGLNMWDIHRVDVTAVGGPDTGFSQLLCFFGGPIQVLLPWHERRIDLSAYRGASVRIAFHFDTVDKGANQLLGWLIDDVSIIAEPGERVCPSAALASGCPCMPNHIPVAGGCRNSTQQSATLLSGGMPSVSQDSLVFTAAHMPLTTLPTLFQGTTVVAPAPFGDGLRCIGGTQIRMGTLVASNGAASWPAAGSPPLSVKGLVPPEGGTRYYQVIYRNAADFCTSATFNLTEAEKIVWLP